MKISKILAGMSAMALAASMMSMAVSADETATKKALFTVTVGKDDLAAGKNGAGPKNNCYKLDPAEKLSKDVLATVDKIEAVVTNDNYVNGTIGANTNASTEFAKAGTLENKTAGTYTWTWSDVGGLRVDDGKVDLEIQFWWMNANGDDKTGYTTATTTVDKVVLYDKSGKVLLTYGGDETTSSAADATSSTVAGDSSKAEETSSAAAGDSSKADDTSKPADDSKPADTKKDVDPMTLKTDLKTADGKVENTAVVLLTELNKDGSVKATSVLDGTGLTNLDVYGATFNITLGDTLAAKLEAGDWVGGGIGWNSESTKWNAAEYCWQDGVKEITAVKQADGSYNVTRTSDKAVFTGTDTYSQAWLQIYNEDDYTINSVTLLGKDGKAIAVVKNNALPDSVKPSDDKKDDNKGGSSVADGSSTTSTTSTTSTNSTGTTSSKAANNASNTNPSTGAAALAAVGVALAGAAVVATKKRK